MAVYQLSYLHYMLSIVNFNKIHYSHTKKSSIYMLVSTVAKATTIFSDIVIFTVICDLLKKLNKNTIN